jgi:hypothetical protein
MPTPKDNYSLDITWYFGTVFYNDGRIEYLHRVGDTFQKTRTVHPDGSVTIHTTDILGNDTDNQT